VLIDDFLPIFDVHERHQIVIHAPLEQVYAIVGRLDISQAYLSMLLFWEDPLRFQPRGFHADAIYSSG
jgi:hypothetical protein